MNATLLLVLLFVLDVIGREPSPTSGATADAYVVSAATLKLRLNKTALREYNAGIAAFSRSEVAAALAHFQATISRTPTFAAAHNNLGVCHVWQNNRELAMSAFRTAITLDSSLPEPHSNLAFLFLESAHFSEAESEARIALKLNPLNTKANFILGLSLMRQHGYTAEAIGEIKKAADTIPSAKKWIDRFENETSRNY